MFEDHNDIDGVLRPSSLSGGEGYHEEAMLITNEHGEERSFPVRVNRQHGPLILDGLDRGIDVRWGSSWNDMANEWLAPRIDLNRPLPVIDVPRRTWTRFGWTSKFEHIEPVIGDRPFCWIDDVFGGKEFGWAEDRTRRGIPTSVIRVEADYGLRDAHVAQVHAWARRSGL